MQYGSATHNPNKQKFFHAQRSAMAPVGMVAVVSMKTIMKKNNAITLTSSISCRKNPLAPISPYLKTSGLAASGSMPIPSLSTTVPGPSDDTQPGGTGPLYQFPQPI